MEALRIQVVALGAAWLIPGLAQHTPTKIEVTIPVRLRQRLNKDQLIEWEHQGDGETFSKVWWPGSERVGLYLIIHNSSRFLHYIRQYMSYKIER